MKFSKFMFGQQYLLNYPKLFCDALCATSAFNLKLCLREKMVLSMVERDRQSNYCIKM